MLHKPRRRSAATAGDPPTSDGVHRVRDHDHTGNPCCGAAGSLAAARDHAAGFAAYERDTRAFVTLNQDQVGTGDAAPFPTTARALEQRNTMLRSLGSLPPPTEGRPAHSALVLPEFRLPG